MGNETDKFSICSNNTKPSWGFNLVSPSLGWNEWHDQMFNSYLSEIVGMIWYEVQYGGRIQLLGGCQIPALNLSRAGWGQEEHIRSPKPRFNIPRDRKLPYG